MLFKLYRMKELNLWLDSYDDIYSDFDSRHYNRRRISEDFIHELRTEMKYRNMDAEHLVLFLPQSIRNEKSEKVILESLPVFFSSQFNFFFYEPNN